MITVELNGNSVTFTADEEVLEELRSNELDLQAACFAQDIAHFVEKNREIVEAYLPEGWEFLRPEEIGALTDSPILAFEVERNEDAELVTHKLACWFPDYMIRDWISELLEGSVTFQLA